MATNTTTPAPAGTLRRRRTPPSEAERQRRRDGSPPTAGSHSARAARDTAVVLQLVPSPTTVPSPVTPLEQLVALQDAELRLLAHAIGDHLAAELVERVLDLRARQAELLPHV